jgi:hypothetical protein
VHLAITVPTVRGTRGSILLHADRGRVPGVPPSGVPVRRRSIHHPSRPGDAPAERGLRRVGKSLLRMALSTATLTSLATRPGPNSMKSSLDSSAGRSGRWSPIPWLQPAGARRYWSSHPIWAAENPSLTTERSRSSARPAP